MEERRRGEEGRKERGEEELAPVQPSQFQNPKTATKQYTHPSTSAASSDY